MNKRGFHPIDKFVGSRVRHARMLLNISQTELSNAIGLTFQQVQKYENGTNRISASKLVQIGIALHQPIAWFFEGAPTTANGNGHAAAADDPVKRLGVNPRGVELARAFVDLSTEKQRVLVQVAQLMAGAPK